MCASISSKASPSALAFRTRPCTTLSHRRCRHAPPTAECFATCYLRSNYSLLIAYHVTYHFTISLPLLLSYSAASSFTRAAHLSRLLLYRMVLPRSANFYQALPPSTRMQIRTTCYAPRTAYYLPLLRTSYCVPLTTHHSPLTARTAYYSTRPGRGCTPM